MREVSTKGMLTAAVLTACTWLLGCGTTKWSDTPRTATEQLLISDAVDRAISEIDFGALEDCSVYLDTRFIATTVDQNYVTSTLRQHMLASGCVIKDRPEDADYIVEVRAGTLGTNRNDVMIGVPATQLPSLGVLPTGSAAIPEIALSKRTNQQAVCKLAVFAYDRQTGRPVWQSGNRQIASNETDTWLLGAGPFQRGSIHEGTAFAGEKIKSPLSRRFRSPKEPSSQEISVGREQRFGQDIANDLDDRGKVSNVGYNETMPQPLPEVEPAQESAAPAASTPREPGALPAEGQPAANAGAANSAAPATADPPAAAEPSAATPEPKASAKVETKPTKPAYTPPVASHATSQPAGSGLQGELNDTKITPVTNPALTAANAMKLAKDILQ